jgi:hypothetical protein
MKKLISILTVSALLLILAGCEEKNRKQSDNLAGKPELKLSCVAEYLRSDGSRYITKQKYEIFRNSDSITLKAKEPFGEIAWSVQNGVYTIQKGVPNKVSDKELYSLIMDKDIAGGLLELYIAGVSGEKPAIGNIGKSLVFEGKSFELAAQKSGVNLYRDKAAGKVNLAVAGTGNKLFLLHGYNYQKNGQKGLYPSKLDIYQYRTDFDKKLIAQISCFLE